MARAHESAPMPSTSKAALAPQVGKEDVVRLVFPNPFRQFTRRQRIQMGIAGKHRVTRAATTRCITPYSCAKICSLTKYYYDLSSKAYPSDIDFAELARLRSYMVTYYLLGFRPKVPVIGKDTPPFLMMYYEGLSSNLYKRLCVRSQADNFPFGLLKDKVFKFGYFKYQEDIAKFQNPDDEYTICMNYIDKMAIIFSVVQARVRAEDIPLQPDVNEALSFFKEIMPPEIVEFMQRHPPEIITFYACRAFVKSECMKQLLYLLIVFCQRLNSGRFPFLEMTAAGISHHFAELGILPAYFNRSAHGTNNHETHCIKTENAARIFDYVLPNTLPDRKVLVEVEDDWPEDPHFSVCPITTKFFKKVFLRLFGKQYTEQVKRGVFFMKRKAGKKKVKSRPVGAKRTNAAPKPEPETAVMRLAELFCAGQYIGPAHLATPIVGTPVVAAAKTRSLTPTVADKDAEIMEDSEVDDDDDDDDEDYGVKRSKNARGRGKGRGRGRGRPKMSDRGLPQAASSSGPSRALHGKGGKGQREPELHTDDAAASTSDALPVRHQPCSNASFQKSPLQFDENALFDIDKMLQASIEIDAAEGNTLNELNFGALSPSMPLNVDFPSRIQTPVLSPAFREPQPGPSHLSNDQASAYNPTQTLITSPGGYFNEFLFDDLRANAIKTPDRFVQSTATTPSEPAAPVPTVPEDDDANDGGREFVGSPLQFNDASEPEAPFRDLGTLSISSLQYEDIIKDTLESLYDPKGMNPATSKVFQSATTFEEYLHNTNHLFDELLSPIKSSEISQPETPIVDDIDAPANTENEAAAINKNTALGKRASAERKPLSREDDESSKNDSDQPRKKKAKGTRADDTVNAMNAVEEAEQTASYASSNHKHLKGSSPRERAKEARREEEKAQSASQAKNTLPAKQINVKNSSLVHEEDDFLKPRKISKKAAKAEREYPSTSKASSSPNMRHKAKRSEYSKKLKMPELREEARSSAARRDAVPAEDASVSLAGPNGSTSHSGQGRPPLTPSRECGPSSSKHRNKAVEEHAKKGKEKKIEKISEKVIHKRERSPSVLSQTHSKKKMSKAEFSKKEFAAVKAGLNQPKEAELKTRNAVHDVQEQKKKSFLKKEDVVKRNKTEWKFLTLKDEGRKKLEVPDKYRKRALIEDLRMNPSVEDERQKAEAVYEELRKSRAAEELRRTQMAEEVKRKATFGAPQKAQLSFSRHLQLANDDRRMFMGSESSKQTPQRSFEKQSTSKLQLPFKPTFEETSKMKWGFELFPKKAFTMDTKYNTMAAMGQRVNGVAKTNTPIQGSLKESEKVKEEQMFARKQKKPDHKNYAQRLIALIAEEKRKREEKESNEKEKAQNAYEKLRKVLDEQKLKQQQKISEEKQKAEKLVPPARIENRVTAMAKEREESTLVKVQIVGQEMPQALPESETDKNKRSLYKEKVTLVVKSEEKMRKQLPEVVLKPEVSKSDEDKVLVNHEKLSIQKYEQKAQEAKRDKSASRSEKPIKPKLFETAQKSEIKMDKNIVLATKENQNSILKPEERSAKEVHNSSSEPKTKLKMPEIQRRPEIKINKCAGQMKKETEVLVPKPEDVKNKKHDLILEQRIKQKLPEVLRKPENSASKSLKLPREEKTISVPKPVEKPTEQRALTNEKNVSQKMPEMQRMPEVNANKSTVPINKDRQVSTSKSDDKTTEIITLTDEPVVENERATHQKEPGELCRPELKADAPQKPLFSRNLYIRPTVVPSKIVEKKSENTELVCNGTKFGRDDFMEPCTSRTSALQQAHPLESCVPAFAIKTPPHSSLKMEEHKEQARKSPPSKTTIDIACQEISKNITEEQQNVIQAEQAEKGSEQASTNEKTACQIPQEKVVPISNFDKVLARLYDDELNKVFGKETSLFLTTAQMAQLRNFKKMYIPSEPAPEAEPAITDAVQAQIHRHRRLLARPIVQLILKSACDMNWMTTTNPDELVCKESAEIVLKTRDFCFIPDWPYDSEEVRNMVHKFNVFSGKFLVNKAKWVVAPIMEQINDLYCNVKQFRSDKMTEMFGTRKVLLPHVCTGKTAIRFLRCMMGVDAEFRHMQLVELIKVSIGQKDDVESIHMRAFHNTINAVDCACGHHSRYQRIMIKNCSQHNDRVEEIKAAHCKEQESAKAIVEAESSTSKEGTPSDLDKASDFEKSKMNDVSKNGIDNFLGLNQSKEQGSEAGKGDERNFRIGIEKSKSDNAEESVNDAPKDENDFSGSPSGNYDRRTAHTFREQMLERMQKFRKFKSRYDYFRALVKCAVLISAKIENRNARNDKTSKLSKISLPRKCFVEIQPLRQQNKRVRSPMLRKNAQDNKKLSWMLTPSPDPYNFDACKHQSEPFCRIRLKKHANVARISRNWLVRRLGNYSSSAFLPNKRPNFAEYSLERIIHAEIDATSKLGSNVKTTQGPKVVGSFESQESVNTDNQVCPEAARSSYNQCIPVQRSVWNGPQPETPALLQDWQRQNSSGPLAIVPNREPLIQNAQMRNPHISTRKVLVPSPAPWVTAGIESRSASFAPHLHQRTKNSVQQPHAWQQTYNGPVISQDAPSKVLQRSQALWNGGGHNSNAAQNCRNLMATEVCSSKDPQPQDPRLQSSRLPEHAPIFKTTFDDAHSKQHSSEGNSNYTMQPPIFIPPPPPAPTCLDNTLPSASSYSRPPVQYKPSKVNTEPTSLPNAPVVQLIWK